MASTVLFPQIIDHMTKKSLRAIARYKNLGYVEAQSHIQTKSVFVAAIKAA